MASCVDSTYRVTATFSGYIMNDCVGGSFDRNNEWLEVIAGTRITPALAHNKQTVMADVEFQDLTTGDFPLPSERQSVVFTMTRVDIGNATPKTVTIVNMRPGNFKGDFNSQPHRFTASFRHDPQGTEDLTPITVA